MFLDKKSDTIRKEIGGTKVEKSDKKKGNRDKSGKSSISVQPGQIV